MDKVLEKFAFNFLIAQIVPAGALIFIALFLRAFASGLPFDAAGEQVVKWSASGAHIAICLLFSIPLGLVLWALGTTSSANMESFRTKYLDDHNHWVDKPAALLRRRLWLRRAVAGAWSSNNIIQLIALLPLILTFDIISILAAQPHDLYKFNALLRAPKIENEVYLSVINELNYSSGYFVNMAIAMLIALVLAGIVLIQRGDWPAVAVFAVTYAVCSVHYLFGRLSKTAFDRCVDPSGAAWAFAFRRSVRRTPAPQEG